MSNDPKKQTVVWPIKKSKSKAQIHTETKENRELTDDSTKNTKLLTGLTLYHIDKR